MAPIISKNPTPPPSKRDWRDELANVVIGAVFFGAIGLFLWWSGKGKQAEQQQLAAEVAAHEQFTTNINEQLSTIDWSQLSWSRFPGSVTIPATATMIVIDSSSHQLSTRDKDIVPVTRRPADLALCDYIILLHEEWHPSNASVKYKGPTGESTVRIRYCVWSVWVVEKASMTVVGRSTPLAHMIRFSPIDILVGASDHDEYEEATVPRKELRQWLGIESPDLR